MFKMQQTMLHLAALLLFPLAAIVSDTLAAPAKPMSSIRYTLTAPAGATWTTKDFDDSAWTKTEDVESIPKAVPKDGEVWIRVRCDLPWEFINNTYAKVNGEGPVEMYVNGKQTVAFGYPSINGWRPWPLSPHRYEQPGVDLMAATGASQPPLGRIKG